MNRLSFTIHCVGLAALCVMGNSAYADHGAYAAISTGATFPSQTFKSSSSSSFVIYSPTSIGTSSFQLPNVHWIHSFQPGITAALVTGYSYNSNWRTDGEFLYQHLNRELSGEYGWIERYLSGETFLIDDKPTPIPNTSSGTNIYSLLLNAYYDFSNQTHLTPFLGAGIGVAWIKSSSTATPGYLNVTSVNPYIDTTTPILANSPALMGAAFAWQIKLGLKFLINSQAGVFAQYRLFVTTKTHSSSSRITTNPNSVDPVPSLFNIAEVKLKGFINNIVEFGLYYNFSV